MIETLLTMQTIGNQKSPRSSPTRIMSNQSICSDQQSSYSNDSYNGKYTREGAPEEPFPMDTVKQIYDDIEKLFSEDPAKANASRMARLKGSVLYTSNLSKGYRAKLQSNRTNFNLNQLISNNQKKLSTPNYVKLCLLEVNLLEKQLNVNFASGSYQFKNAMGGDINQISTRKNPPRLVNNNKVNNNRPTDPGLVCISDLDSLVWGLFTLYDKLTEFVRIAQSLDKNTKPKSNDSFGNEAKAKLLAKISDTIKQWYAIAVAIKDKMITTNNVNELLSLLSSIKQQYLEQLLKLTRNLRTLLWLCCSSNLSSSNDTSRRQFGTNNSKALYANYSK